MAWLSRLFGKKAKAQQGEFSSYRTEAEREAFAQAMVGAKFITEGKFDDAVKICEMALKGNPRCKEAWMVRGGALGLLQRYDEAIASEDKALQIDPKYQMAWFQKGSALAKSAVDLTRRRQPAEIIQGRADEALRCLNKALEINPNDANVLKTKRSLEVLLTEVRAGRY